MSMEYPGYRQPESKSSSQRVQSSMRARSKLAVFAAITFLAAAHNRGLPGAQEVAKSRCPRPAVGSTVPEPAELRSRNGLLTVDLGIRDEKQADGTTRYCYIDANGDESPTLRVKPGDLVTLNLKNDLTDLQADVAANAPQHLHVGATDDPCAGERMTPTSTNLHFHGLSVSSARHQGDVFRASIQP